MPPHPAIAHVDSAAPPIAGRRLVGIDALRGVAALAVLICHLPFSLSTTPAQPGDAAPVAVSFPGWALAVTGYGEYGVHLFLVLSGFCIHMAVAKSGGHAAPKFLGFWRRRLHRLYPPYFVALVFTLAAIFFLFSILGHPTQAGLGAHFGYPSTSQFVVDLILLVLLLQNVNGASIRVGNGPFWSLALEEQLYILYFGLLHLRRGGWARTLLVVGGVTLAWRAAVLLWPGALPNYWLVIGPSRWFEWVLGALAVEAHLGRVRLPAWCSAPWAAAVSGLMSIAVNAPPIRDLAPAVLLRDASMGLTFFIVINHACRARWGEGPNTGWVVRNLRTVGLFSYSLYLTHAVVIVAVKQFALRLGMGVPVITVLRLVVPIAFSYLFYRVVERRFVNQSRTTSREHRTAA